MRHCEICAGADQDLIRRQHFLFPGQAAPVHYDVVACRQCGFAFATDIPDQSVLNAFYQGAEHHLHQQVPPGLARIHEDFFDFVRTHVPLPGTLRVLDIGSGMGHFLSRFKAAGLDDLLGIEPSPAAARLGREAYGIDIRPETLDSLSDAQPFGLVSLCGVLEHIADLTGGMAKISTLLEEGGYLFLAVPDVMSFGAAPPAEPFLEFALEHINFFSETSLDNLLRGAGFEKVEVISQHNDFYDNHYLLALYRKAGEGSVAIEPDRSSADSLRRYVAFSQARLAPVAEQAEQLVASGEPLVIWGAGGLTSRLLCDTRLGEANIRAIVDRNKALQGKPLLGVAITAPESVREHPDATVFIASTTYAEEIRRTLVDAYGWTGRIICLAEQDTDRQ
ncbi:class I SAM-dependent methyltransferase [Metapseudomonas furukawaii]